MLRVTLILDRLHCHAETDSGSNSEPYLWTSFFKGDIQTIPLGPGNRLVTFTHHDFSSGREFLPDSVQTGDNITIPSEVGRHTFLVDPGGFFKAAVGFVVALLEEDDTPEKAIRAGHEAFAEAINAELNNFVDSIFPNFHEPSDDKVKKMAANVEKEVKEAIRDELSWYHFLNNHDDVFGFAHDIFQLDELNDLASQNTPEKAFPSKRIRHERKLLDPSNGKTITLVNDYEIFGRIRAEKISRFPDACQSEFSSYNEAVKRIHAIDQDIANLQKELSNASPTEKKLLTDEIDFLRKVVRADALEIVASTLVAYERCRNSVRVSPGILELKSVLQERRRRRHENRNRRLALAEISSQLDVIGPKLGEIGDIFVDCTFDCIKEFNECLAAGFPVNICSRRFKTCMNACTSPPIGPV